MCKPTPHSLRKAAPPAQFFLHAKNFNPPPKSANSMAKNPTTMSKQTKKNERGMLTVNMQMGNKKNRPMQNSKCQHIPVGAFRDFLLCCVIACTCLVRNRSTWHTGTLHRCLLQPSNTATRPLLSEQPTEGLRKNKEVISKKYNSFLGPTLLSTCPALPSNVEMDLTWTDYSLVF